MATRYENYRSKQSTQRKNLICNLRACVRQPLRCELLRNWLGDPAEAKSWSSQALDRYNERVVWPAAWLAWAGDIARPKKVIEAQGKSRPNDTVLQESWIPQLAQWKSNQKRESATDGAPKVRASKQYERLTFIAAWPTFQCGRARRQQQNLKRSLTGRQSIHNRCSNLIS